MQLSGFRLLGAASISLVISLTAACGGSTQEAKAPSLDGAQASAVGSSAPELSTPITPSDTPPPKTTAVSSKDDGSDIIPPFTAKEPTKKSAKPKKGASAKPKKKG